MAVFCFVHHRFFSVRPNDATNPLQVNPLNSTLNEARKRTDERSMQPIDSVPAIYAKNLASNEAGGRHGQKGNRPGDLQHDTHTHTHTHTYTPNLCQLSALDPPLSCSPS